MKKQPLRIVLLIVIVLLALAVVAMMLYDVIVKKDTSSIPKALLLLIALFMTLLKLFGVIRSRGQVPPEAYRKHYAELVGNAFSGDPK